MSATFRNASSPSAPTGTATAAVLEFRCLYTHDIRRKAKRWQDGFLRFHTFNKRIMVYDVPRNLIGGLHWQDSQMIEEGAEVRLDMGVLVEVAELVGTTETDVSAIVQKKSKSANEEIRRNIGKITREPSIITNAGKPTLSQSRHKPLSAVLGTPRGRLGRAMLPEKSPYDSRVENSSECGRERKRQRVADPPISPKPQRAKRATTSFTEQSLINDRVLKPNTVKLNAQKQVNAGAGKPVAETVDLSSDPECEPFSDVTLPETSPRKPTNEMPKTDRQRTARLRTPPKQPHEPTMPSSPPVSIANKISSIDRELEVPPNQIEPENRFQTRPINHKVQPKSIKLTTGRTRKTLLCETLKTRNRISTTTGIKTGDHEKKKMTGPGRLEEEPEPQALARQAPERSGSELHEPDMAGKSKATKGNSGVLKDLSESCTRQREPSEIINQDITVPIIEEIEDNLFVDIDTQAPTVGNQTRRKPNQRSNPFNVGPPPDRQRDSSYNFLSSPPISNSAVDAIVNRPFRRVRSENDKSVLPRTSVGIDSEKPRQTNIGMNEGSIGGNLQPPGKPNLLTHSTMSRIRSNEKSVRDATESRMDKSSEEDTLQKKDVGPWSSEALDLFDWRPPGMAVPGMTTKT